VGGALASGSCFQRLKDAGSAARADGMAITGALWKVIGTPTSFLFGSLSQFVSALEPGEAWVPFAGCAHVASLQTVCYCVCFGPATGLVVCPESFVSPIGFGGCNGTAVPSVSGPRTRAPYIRACQFIGYSEFVLQASFTACKFQLRLGITGARIGGICSTSTGPVRTLDVVLNSAFLNLAETTGLHTLVCIL